MSPTSPTSPMSRGAGDPTPELGFEPAGPRPLRGAGPTTLLGRAGRLGLRLLVWTPVLVPAGLCLQFALLGLRPVWLEGRRLEQRAAEVDGRIEGLLADRALLRREQQMLADPIYRERVRRSRAERGSPTLRLADALALEAGPPAVLPEPPTESR